MVQNAYNTYKNNSVMTASPQELTLMLYNGAIKFCNQAIEQIDNRNIEKAHNYIIRVQDIIEEFRITLDRKYEISKEFDVLYEYMYWRLVQANFHKDKTMVEEVLGMFRELRDTWKQVMAIGKTGNFAVGE